jgi:hypothetical protein
MKLITLSDHESYHDEPEIRLHAHRTYRLLDIYKTNENKLMIHAYTYTNRAPPIFTVCGYHRKKGSLDELVTFNYMYIVYKFNPYKIVSGLD